jgi:hypothetical protein
MAASQAKLKELEELKVFREGEPLVEDCCTLEFCLWFLRCQAAGLVHRLWGVMAFGCRELELSCLVYALNNILSCPANTLSLPVYVFSCSPFYPLTITQSVGRWVASLTASMRLTSAVWTALSFLSSLWLLSKAAQGVTVVPAVCAMFSTTALVI